MPPHKARTSSAVRHGHHGMHSRSSSATRLPGAGAAGNMNLQLTQKDPHPTGKLTRTSSSQRVQSREHLAGLGMTQTQNHKQKPQAQNHTHAQSRAGVKQNAQPQQQQAAAKGTRAGFAMAPSADGSDSSDEEEEEDTKGNDKGGEGDDDEEWVSTAESGAATPNHLESDSDTEAEVDAEPTKGSNVTDAQSAKGSKNEHANPNPRGVLNTQQVNTQLLQQQNQQQQRDSSREQKARPDALKRNDTARAGDFVIVKPPPLVPVLQQMQQSAVPATARPARTPTNATGAPVQHARHRGEQEVPVLQAPPAVQKSNSDRERGGGVMERETSMDSTSTTTKRSRPSSRATAAPQGRQLAPTSQGQIQPRPERPKRSRPPSTHSVTKGDGQHLRPHPLIRGHSFNAAASATSAPGLTTGGGAGPSALMGLGGGGATPKPAPLAPLTVIPTSSDYPDVSAGTPPPASGSSSMRGYFVSSSPASMKTMPTTSPSSDGVGGNSDKRRQSFSSQHSVTTIPVHSTIIREPTAQPAPSTSGYSFGYPRARTLSTMSTNSSSAALSSLAQQLPSGVSSPHPSSHSTYHPHAQPHSSASSIYSSSSVYHGGHPSAHPHPSSSSYHPHSAHPSYPSTRPPSPLAPPQISFFPPVNPYANVEGIHPLLPNPYLCNHLTVLSRRAPIRESWERVMKARKGVGQA